MEKKDEIIELLSKFKNKQENTNIEIWIYQNKEMLLDLHFKNEKYKWKDIADALTVFLSLKESLKVSFLTKTISLNIYNSLIKVNRS